MKKTLLALAALILSISSSYANEETISLYADICEKMEPEETVSQVRTRAADKAIFSAVEKLPVLELPRKEFDLHDFNILVYKLVDNYIENLNVRTVRQDSQKVCIEVDGYIKGANIISSVLETKEIADKRAARRAEENLTGSSPLKTQKEIENIIMKEAKISPIDPTIIDSPKVQGQIIRMPDLDEERQDAMADVKQDIIYTEQETNDTTNTDFEEDLTTSNQKVIIQDSDTIIIINDEDTTKKNSNIDREESDEALNEPKKGLVYIAATKFFDSSTSQEHSNILKKLFSNNEYFNLTEDKELADYIVSPNILRIKIDAINNITNRMQMVVMVELDDIYSDTNVKEHQNRFTLLSIEDDEQEIAQDLMNKLLEKAGTQILTKIEVSERKKNNIKGLPKIITPSNSQVVDDSLS